MSTVITIRPGEIPRAIVHTQATIMKRARLACRAAALRLKGHLMRRTDELGITDMAIYKNSFRVVRAKGGGSAVINEAPHAGIVELGARPHKVSKAGVEAIAGWVRRKLRKKFQPRSAETGHYKTKKFDEDEAMSIAWAIAQKIRKFGQKPRYVMRDSLPAARQFYAEELSRLMTEGVK